MSQEKSSNETLSEKIDEFFPVPEKEAPAEKPVVEASKLAVMPANPMLEEFEEELTQEMKEQEDAENDEEAEKKNSDSEEEKENLNRKLTGYPKGFKDLARSVEDKELQAKILEVGKVSRAREDRLSLELGNLKKEHGATKELLQFIDRDPKGALKHIAKITKVDLGSLIEKPVPEQDDYDYRTPEEISRDKAYEDIKREVAELRNQKSHEELSTIEQEISVFADSKDEEGNLKYPHFEKLNQSIYDILGIYKQRFGIPKNSSERNQRLEKAYHKALLLDDELITERDADLLKRAQKKKEAEIDKAKKLKKFSGRTTSVHTKPSSSREAMSEIYDRFYSTAA